MSDKKPNANSGKTTAKNANKKPTSGKVTKPLRPASAAKSGQTGSTAEKKSSGNRKAKLFDRLKKSEEQGAYTSVKNLKNKRGFLGKASGASSRGGFEQDKNRFRTIWVIALVVLGLLIARAYYLQVANAQFYQDKGDELITSVRTQKSYRGMITDRNNLPLAVSAPLATVSFSPHDYAREYYELKRIIITNPESPQLVARMQKRLDNMDLTTLAAAANISVTELKKVTAIDDSIDVTDEAAVKAALPSGAGSHYLPLLNKVTPEIAQSVSTLDFPGVYEKNFFQRYYPQPQPNSQLLGFMGQNVSDPEGGYEGRAGIERQYETELAGDDGKVLVLKDAKQNSLKEIKQIEPEIPGKDVALTIDSRLQYLLYKELEKAGRLQKARWSTGMIVDVQTGEVLALSTWPSFNSNNLNEMTGENQRNRALLDVFEPGSVMKPFTVAAAFRLRKIYRHYLDRYQSWLYSCPWLYHS